MSERRRHALGFAALAIVAAMPPPLDADALGNARLLFTPAERGVTESGPREDDPTDGERAASG